MIHDRLYLRRRRDSGWRPSYQTGRITRERAIETGYKHVARLASTIEARTGASLKSRRALDFGCGWGRLAIPLAERCEHVYGVDAARSVLQEAERNATSSNVTNIEWLQTGQLAELSGRYDLVISMLVFQHIPVKEGERLFAMLVGGLRPGGVGAINIVLRPDNPWGELLRRTKRWLPFRRDPADEGNGSNGRSLRVYRHMLMGSYSLNRLGRLLDDGGVSEWNVEFLRAGPSQSFDAVTLYFRKDAEPGASG